MTTFADSLKKEIARVARKELRQEIDALRKASSLQRSEIAMLKKSLKGLESQLKKLGKGSVAPLPTAQVKLNSPAEIAPRGKPGRKVEFSPQRLKTQRAKLGFTQEQMAGLLGVSALSIWKWESGGAAPRASRVPMILQRLALGKREALTLLGSTEA